MIYKYACTVQNITMEIYHTCVFAMLYHCLYVVSVLWAGGLLHNKSICTCTIAILAFHQ